MTSNLQSVNRLNDSNSQSYHEKLGSYGSIDVRKKTVQKENTYYTRWGASYTIDGSRNVLDIYRTANGKIDSNDNGMNLVLHDEMYSKESCITFDEDIDIYDDSSTPTYLVGLQGAFKKCTQKYNKTINSLGYVTETRAYIYGSERRCGLFVVEVMKKNINNERACKITVAHYYAVHNENMFNANKIDIGLSIIVTIQPLNIVGFDIHIEGPAKHPRAALICMFQEVMKTGIWKHTTCLNFASRNSDMLRQEESEDNENSPPGVLDRILNRGIFNINNSGSVEGNYNGSNVIQGDLNVYNNYYLISRSIIRR